MKNIDTLGNHLRKAILYGTIASFFLISLYGCGPGGNPSSNKPQITPPKVPSGKANIPTGTHPAGITVTVGAVNTPLPSNIPLPTHSQLLQEYGSTLNGASATVWVYAQVGPSASASSVISFYNSNMPPNGWTSIDVPSQIQQGQSAGTVVAFQQGAQMCTIAAGSSTSQSGGVVLTITLAG